MICCIRSQNKKRQTLSLTVSRVLYDTVGRRTSALVGLMIAASASAISAFAPDAYIMMIHRFLQGTQIIIFDVS